MTIRYRTEKPEDLYRDLGDDEDLPDPRAYGISIDSGLYCDTQVKKKRVMYVRDAVPRHERRAKLKMLQVVPLPVPLRAIWDYLWKGDHLVTGSILRFWVNENTTRQLSWFVDRIMQGHVNFTLNKYGLELIEGLQRVPYTVMTATKIAPLARACLPMEGGGGDQGLAIWEDQSLYKKAIIQQLSVCAWNERLASELPRIRMLTIFVIIANTDDIISCLRRHSENDSYSLDDRIAILRLCDVIGCSKEGDERFANLLQYLH